MTENGFESATSGFLVAGLLFSKTLIFVCCESVRHEAILTHSKIGKAQLYFTISKIDIYLKLTFRIQSNVVFRVRFDCIHSIQTSVWALSLIHDAMLKSQILDKMLKLQGFDSFNIFKMSLRKNSIIFQR